MSIMPVQNVNLNGRSVSFQGRNNNEDEMPMQSHHNRMPMKAIPVIALIAMSPMTNVNKSYATEPNKNMIEMVESPNTQQVKQSKFVPMPSNFKILKQVRLNVSEREFYDLNLISTDGNNKNYEEVEYKEYSLDGERVLKRGMLKAATFFNNGDGKDVELEGIELDKNNLDNYAPQGVFRRFIGGSLIKEAFNTMVRLNSNNAVYCYKISQSYVSEGYYDDDLKTYKQELGIK